MAEATAMLVDSGRLGARHLPALDRLFRNADPYFLIVRPTRRPSIVAPIAERADSQYVGGSWTADVNAVPAITGRTMPSIDAEPTDAQQRMIPEPQQCDTSHASPRGGSADDGWIVLAEETWLRWLDWKLATETRVGSRLDARAWASIEPDNGADADDIDGDTAADQSLDAHVADLSHLMADECVTRGRAPYSIVVRNLTYRFETPVGSWLAFNPALADELRWRPAPDGLFRWLDADGEVVAESVWWQDGFAQQRPPLFEEEVGYGWLVRVSPSGWRQLAPVVGPCVDWRRVARLAQEQQPHETEAWDQVPEGKI